MQVAEQASYQRWQQQIKELHTRYQREVIEGFNLCPYAVGARKAGEVRRYFFWPEMMCTAQTVQEVIETLSRLEPYPVILLLVFVGQTPDHWMSCEDLKKLQQSLSQESYLSAVFHPQTPRQPRPKHPSALIPWMRRAPDPLLQCVHKQTLEDLRAASQAKLKQQMLARLPDPQIRERFAQCVLADDLLSAQIAQNNYERWGTQDNWQTFYESIESIQAARRQLMYPS